LTSRTRTVQGLHYSRRRRLEEASSGDREHAGRVETEVERAERVAKLPRAAGPSVDELLRRRHNAERAKLELAPYPVPAGVLEGGRRRRPGVAPSMLLCAVVVGLVGWTLIAGLVYLVVELA
jgi:hypothetical protein